MGLFPKWLVTLWRSLYIHTVVLQVSCVLGAWRQAHVQEGTYLAACTQSAYAMPGRPLVNQKGLLCNMQSQPDYIIALVGHWYVLRRLSGVPTSQFLDAPPYSCYHIIVTLKDQALVILKLITLHRPDQRNNDHLLRSTRLRSTAAQQPCPQTSSKTLA